MEQEKDILWVGTSYEDLLVVFKKRLKLPALEIKKLRRDAISLLLALGVGNEY